MRHIKDAFKTAMEDSEGGAGGGETCLLLAHVLFIYGVLFPRDSEAKKLDMKYLHVCDDLKSLMQFPWGLCSYKYFVEEFDKACDRMNRLVKKKDSGKPKFEIFGFLFGFQCWMYEIFPLLGASCAYTLQGSEDIYPRVLRWKTTLGQWTCKNVQIFLDGAKIVHPLIASNEEQMRLSAHVAYLDEEFVLEEVDVNVEDEQPVMDDRHE